MNKVNNATQKRAPKLIDEIEAEAAAQDKPFMVYLAE
jgi:proline dehydrogenase